MVNDKRLFAEAGHPGRDARDTGNAWDTGASQGERGLAGFIINHY